MEKQELTPKIAEEFAREIFSKFNDEEQESQLWHAKAVVNATLILSQNKKVNKETLNVAGWIHDIGRSINAENHAEHSLEILEKKFSISPTLKDCILNHGSSEKPKTEEGKIFQLADKSCILNPEFINLLIKYNRGVLKKEDSTWLEKMTSNSIKLLKEYKF